MSVPLPPTDLEGHCSAIYDDVLYVLSPTALQSLSLQEHAEWATQPLGQAVTGPACVTAVPEDDPSNAAMYVIGGQTTDDSYGGLQRFFFGNKTWETLSPPVNVLAGRYNHSAAYLNDSQSIFVYAGSQPSAPSYLSSQTFLISTEPPYNILSYESKAPTTNLPILTAWNSSHAVMMGGTTTNKELWLFGPHSGWSRLPIDLEQPLEKSTRVTLVDLDNGAKVLEVYNVTATPNTVTDVVLLDAQGKPAKTGQTVGKTLSTQVRERDLTLSNWPTYNDSNAPSVVRSDCAIARSSNGLVVLSGGNTEAPLAMFNQANNTWIEPGQYFQDPAQQPLRPSSTPTSTASASASASTAPITGSSHNSTDKILGITLGVLFGVAALLIVALLLLRRRKLRQRREQEQQVEKDGGDRMSFADRGASFMKEAGISLGDLAPPSASRYDSSRASNSSLAIIAGKFGNRRSTNRHAPATSFDSTAQLVHDKHSNLAAGEQVEMMDIGEKSTMATLTVPGMAPGGTLLDSEAKARRKRSSGWSKYFATSQPNRLSHLPSAYANTQSGIFEGQTGIIENPTQPRVSRTPSLALVPPIDTDTAKVVDGQRVSHVTSGSPSYSDSREDLVLRGSNVDGFDGQTGTIIDPNPPRKSHSNSVSSYGNRSTVSSNVTSELFNETSQVPWTPMNTNNNNVSKDVDSRRTSSVYTASVDYSARRPSRGKSPGFFPGAGTSYRPASNNKSKMSYAAGPTSEWAAPPKLPFAAQTADRDSTVTVFPSGLPSPVTATHGGAPSKQNDSARNEEQNEKPANTDMSWLNLGLGQEHS